MSNTDALEKIHERLDAIDQTLLRNTITLEEHVRRTELLEAEMKPVKDHVTLVQGLLKLGVGILGAAVGLKHLGLL